MDKNKMFKNLDALIDLQEQKVQLLKDHKQGLIQHFKKAENESKNN